MKSTSVVEQAVEEVDREGEDCVAEKRMRELPIADVVLQPVVTAGVTLIWGKKVEIVMMEHRQGPTIKLRYELGNQKNNDNKEALAHHWVNSSHYTKDSHVQIRDGPLLTNQHCASTDMQFTLTGQSANRRKLTGVKQ